MFDFRRKDQFDFGSVSSSDDRDIEVNDLRKEARNGFWWESLRLFRDIFLIIVVLILFGVFFVQPVVVDGSSMLPQLHDGERLLVNKFIYYKVESVSWGHLERGDVVVFWFPDDPDKSYVKRLIGLPGETVEVKDGKVYINDIELQEPYLDEEHNRAKSTFQPQKVEPHHYFVMGDNRDNSSDSRYWGSVPEKYIYGRAFFRYWQPQSLGFIKQGQYPIGDRPVPSDVRAEE
jgi:signal peptidase I